jgi:hypothetical protein
MDIRAILKRLSKSQEEFLLMIGVSVATLRKTNYRDFVLIGKDAAGNQIKLETLRLAETEQSFWTQAAHPRKAAEKCGERLIQYLTRRWPPRPSSSRSDWSSPWTGRKPF